MTSAARASSTGRACSDTASEGWPITSATPAALAGSTVTPGRLRKLFWTPASSASQITSVRLPGAHLASASAARLVDGSE